MHRVGKSHAMREIEPADAVVHRPVKSVLIRRVELQKILGQSRQQLLVESFRLIARDVARNPIESLVDAGRKNIDQVAKVFRVARTRRVQRFESGSIAFEFRYQVFTRRVTDRTCQCRQQVTFHGAAKSLQQPPGFINVNQRMAEVVVVRQGRRRMVNGPLYLLQQSSYYDYFLYPLR